jgi:hypothetical protein
MMREMKRKTDFQLDISAHQTKMPPENSMPT